MYLFTRSSPGKLGIVAYGVAQRRVLMKTWVGPGRVTPPPQPFSAVQFVTVGPRRFLFSAGGQIHMQCLFDTKINPDKQ